MTSTVLPMPTIGMEGEIGPIGMMPPSVEGELGLHMVTLLPNSEMLTQLFELARALPKMIADAKMPEGKTFSHIPPDQIQLMNDIHVMLRVLQEESQPSNQEPVGANRRADVAKMAAQKPEVHRSLFSLASAMNSAAAKQTEPLVPVNQPATVQVATPPTTQKNIEKNSNSLKVEEREAGGGQKRDQQPGDQKKKQPHASINKVLGKKVSTTTPPNQTVNLESIDNIYVKFMALMARILGQAEAEAHQLYIKIKDRTDKIDTLSLLMAKINNAGKAIDWSNDPQMKELVDRAREIGVDLPEGKYKWEESEKHLLKENIQMRKDSMEKITQLERTDMQRYLQEASQCHQARSNVLKLLKEVIDTIIHNMRP